MLLLPLLKLIIVSTWPLYFSIFPSQSQIIITLLFIFFQITFLVELILKIRFYKLYLLFPSFEEARDYFKEGKRVKEAESVAKKLEVKKTKEFGFIKKQKEAQLKKNEDLLEKKKFLDDLKKNLEIRAKKVLYQN
jgi:hypothetical protein